MWLYGWERSWSVTHTLARAPASVLTHQRDTSTPKASEAEMKEKKTPWQSTRIFPPTHPRLQWILSCSPRFSLPVFLLSKKFAVSLMTAMCNRLKKWHKQTNNYRLLCILIELLDRKNTFKTTDLMILTANSFSQIINKYIKHINITCKIKFKQAYGK